ncbi:hypothetical protein [Pedobacter deserti]|uniref:hypothetical protein n=1 Tax=Pedobacter deserti TaxID=2817382 RepID=UPI00210F22CA|nr:hypothetical protein [Pedobacter sp. SYSU D00382]
MRFLIVNSSYIYLTTKHLYASMKTMLSAAKLYAGLCLLMISILACEKNVENEEPLSGFGDIAYVAKASVPAAKALSARSIDTSTTVDVAWSSATVYVEKISFAGRGNSDLDTTISIEKNLDILSAGALAGIIQLPSGSYRNVEIKLLCRKSQKSDLAFRFRGTFRNSYGGTDSVLVGSSFPFEANLDLSEIMVKPSDNYLATFNFDLDKVLTGISTRMLESTRSYIGKDGKRSYAIFKGGSQDEPFYDQVIANWQTVASVVLSKADAGTH